MDLTFAMATGFFYEKASVPPDSATVKVTDVEVRA